MPGPGGSEQARRARPLPLLRGEPLEDTVKRRRTLGRAGVAGKAVSKNLRRPMQEKDRLRWQEYLDGGGRPVERLSHRDLGLPNRKATETVD